MARTAQAGAVFLVGFIGWLGAAQLHVQGPAVYAVALGLGAVAGCISPRMILLSLFWFGMLASYPAALGLGVIAFLGENWVFYAVLFLAIAGFGFAVSAILRRVVSWRPVATNR